ncbi:TetR/AcrR family transcriptional regulator [Antrihabitans sp. YC3-6]|uniref:TetR/AcrR family transcriptional regulator n=1 Tax=Antrihabitans stalagmiti TaxID=2799499 RepID=A0A934NQK6_9NOCA|nr:TetR/AcrR family transcriptional regulator [Antrihabitans stalagmiti]MBJ8339425.1 TetR/AcrR family transcriptional regulator [Antrihabitans stalagmiti]
MRTTEKPRKSANGAGSTDDDLTQRRRKEIADGACVVFDQRGYANTRIADISDHLGVGQGTIYRYFTGKEDLMDHIVGHAVRRILAAMREDGVGDSPVRTAAQFVDQITAVAHRLLDMAARESVLVRVLLVQAQAARPDAIDDLTDQLAVTTAGYLANGVESGYLREDLDTAAVADAMVGITMPAMRRVLRDQLDDAGREATARTIGRLIAYGAVEPEFAS